jgi:TonB-dependent starch-binding outer membrane protein SusC
MKNIYLRKRSFSSYTLLPILKMSSLLLITLLAFQHPLQARDTLIDTHVTIHVSQESVRKVLLSLEKQTGLKFFYLNDQVDTRRKVTLRLERATLRQVLDDLFRDTDIYYYTTGKQIVLRKKQTPEQAALGRQNYTGPGEMPGGVPAEAENSEVRPVAPQHRVTGQVIDEQKTPLPGVNVLIKGTSNGTTTDAEGRYVLDVPDEGATLVFSFIGYATQEVAAGVQTEINVTLEADIKTLTEVVVVGYGSQKRSDLTGSIASVSNKEIKAVAITSADQALQGRAPGVQVIQNSSAPGAGTTVRIRGGNSIQGGNEPLYVIDGIPVYNDNGSSGAAVNGLSSISPGDIESIEILKDASATAIYGSRGANGVVIITTKRGKAGQSSITFESYYGIQQVRRKYPLLNATEFATLVNEANTNDGRPAVYTADQIAAFGDGTDWQEEIFRQAPIQNYQLTLSGGDDKTQYAISGNLFRQNGIVVNSDFTRASFRVNLDRKVTTRFKVGNSLTFSRAITDAIPNEGDLGAAGKVIANALQSSPLVPVYKPDGTYTIDNLSGQSTDNPVALAHDFKNRIGVSRVLGSVFGEYELTKGLVLKILGGIDGAYTKNNSYLPRSVLSGLRQGGVATIINSQTLTWLNENTLTYTRSISEKHHLTLLAGYTQQASRYESATAASRNFVNDIQGYSNLGAGSVTLTPSSSIGTWGLVSYLARANYNYGDKYLFTVTGRYDGSSRFGANNRFGFFPSASAAWRLIEEPFVRELNAFSDLKLRVSYGLTGNQEGIGNYPSAALLSTQNYVLGNAIATGVGPSQIANPDLKWETTAQADIGLDVAFFGDRLLLTADVYQKRTRDLLLRVTIPSGSGYSSALKNVGKVENKGIEIGINSRNFVGAFTWTTSLNFASNRNTVLDIGGVSQILAGQVANIGQNLNSGIIRVGESLGSFYGYVTDGVFQAGDNIAGSAQPTAKPGDRRYKNLNSDNVIDDSDRQIIGRAQPKFLGGITNTFGYKGVELTVFFQGVYGNNILNANRFELEYLNGANNQGRDMLDRWTPENTDTNIPRATTNRAPNRISTRQIEDGSYLRLKNIQLAYNFPQALTSKIRLQSLRVYASAQNYATWTNYSGYDPEVNRFGQENVSQGFDYGSYPAAKTILFGLQVGL